MEMNRFSLRSMRRFLTTANPERQSSPFRRKINSIVAYALREGGVYAPKALMWRHLNRHRRQRLKAVIDHTKSGSLKDEPDNAYRRLQQGLEALRPAFLCNDKVKTPAYFTTLGVLLAFLMLCSSGGMAEAQDKTFKRTIEAYTVPDVTLVNQNGARVRIKSLLQSDKPVVVDFIFGTCTTICPVLSAGLASLQQQLGADARKVQLVSISIDPENDTPKVLRDYLKRYGAKPGWDFLTGTRTDIDKVLYALSAYIPNKMDHYPLTLIRSPGDGKWVRVRGLMSGAQLISEVRQAGLK